MKTLHRSAFLHMVFGSLAAITGGCSGPTTTTPVSAPSAANFPVAPNAAATTQPTAAPAAATALPPTAAVTANTAPASLAAAAGAPAVTAPATMPTTPTMPAMLAPGQAPPSPYSLFDAATHTLAAPKPGDGVQVTTKEFDLRPGDEQFTCYHGELPQDGELNVKYWESTMTTGSHHFILYKADNDASPVGTMDPSGCLSNFTGWIYSSAQPHIDLQIPEGVAMPLGSRQRVNFDMHYINTTDKSLKVMVNLNAIFAKGEFQKAASLISYNAGIFLQPHAAQSVEGDCTPGRDAKFFYMLTHTHRRGHLATISRVLSNGMLGEEFIKSTDWELPQEKKWISEPFTTFQQGEKIRYHCDYQNDLDQVVTAGPSAQTNEMCMAIMYYFPASAGGSCR